jgi:hypothetical protein
MVETCPDCGGALKHRYVPGVPALACDRCGTLIELSLHEWLQWIRLAQERLDQRVRQTEKALERSRSLLRRTRPPG